MDNNKLKFELDDVIGKIANFLFVSQVSFNNKIVLNNQEGKEKKIICSPFNSNIEITWFFKFFGGSWHFKDDQGSWKLLPVSDLVRLPVFGFSYHQDVFHPFVERKKIFSKIKYYSHYNDFLMRGFKHLINKFLNVLIGGVKSSHDCQFKNLSKDGGITFRVNMINNNVLEMSCVDVGGIYDKTLDDETTTWPDQVPVGHYSTEFASYVFYWMWKRTNDPKWLDSCQKSLVFFINNFRPYTCVTFNSYEFKVLPIGCLIKDIVDNGDDGLFDLEKIKQTLCDDWFDYDPVNIHALRLANFSVLKSIGININQYKQKLSFLVVSNNQTDQGLIADNRGGSLCYSADLTYHQFSLGCLVLAHYFSPDPDIKNIIEKAINFSHYTSTVDGHVSYYGRGANNVYHLAAFLFAESNLESPNYDHIFNIIKNISIFADPVSGLPSALNDQREKRMAWNHCEVPYNGQVAFFLCRAYGSLFGGKKSSGLGVVKKYNDLNGVLDFIRLDNDIFQITIGRGSDIHEWSGGAHVVGMGGICSLSVKRVGNCLSANEYSAVDRCWTGDLPVDGRRESVGNYFVGKLTKISEAVVSLSLKDLNIIYKLESNFLKVNYTLKNDLTNYKTYSGLSFQVALVKSYLIEEKLCTIIFINGDILKLRTDDNFIIKSSVIISNPFGGIIRFELVPHHSLVGLKSFSWILSYVGKQ